MKKTFTLLSLIFLAGSLFAQLPQKMSYQAVIRDPSNKLVTNQQISMRISVIQFVPNGMAVYTETQNASTNGNGLVSLEIGTGSVSKGRFENIDWPNGPFYLKTETDPKGGTNYSVVSITELLSVPYALYAKSAEKVTGELDERDPVFNRSEASKVTNNDILNLSHLSGVNTGDQDLSSLATKKQVADSIARVRGEIPDVSGFITREIDPLFSDWDRSSGVRITESQITDLKHFSNSDEIDPKYAADSTFIKSGIRNWNGSLARKITEADTAWWGRAEIDPLFSGWDRSSGISITESQITDLKHFTNSDEIDPKYAADSAFIKSGVLNWNGSLARKITEADTAWWGRAEIDPVYTASPAHGITDTDIENWNAKSEFDGNYSNLTNAPDIANSTLNKSISMDAGGSFTIKDPSNTLLNVNQSSGSVGIGRNVTNPRASLEVGGTDGILSTGTTNSGTARALGAGLRFMWYPRKGALRVGMAESNYWDDDGSTSPKLALYSCAIGYQPRATGVASYALGAYAKATGDYALSLGSYSTASGVHSVAIGTQVYASGIYSTAIGAGADTNGKDGSMVIGDDTYFQTAYASNDNQLTMRFSGGYRFWTSYPDSVAGVYMRHGQSGWSNYCDRNRKENFEKLDYEDVLKRIQGNIPVTRWNYKGIDSLKYIGPMAQDFYAAFPLNGTDSLGINSICMDGVNLAAIRGLIDRTDALKSALDELRKQKEQVVKLEAMVEEQNAIINEMRRDLQDLKISKAK